MNSSCSDMPRSTRTWVSSNLGGTTWRAWDTSSCTSTGAPCHGRDSRFVSSSWPLMMQNPVLVLCGNVTHKISNKSHKLQSETNEHIFALFTFDLELLEHSLEICTNAGGGVISGQYQICSKTKKISGCDKEAEIREDQWEEDVHPCRSSLQGKTFLSTYSMPFLHGQSLIVFVKILTFTMGNLSKALWFKGSFVAGPHIPFLLPWPKLVEFRFLAAFCNSGARYLRSSRTNLRAELQSLCWQPICAWKYPMCTARNVESAICVLEEEQ